MVGPDGDAAELVRRSGTGCAVRVDDAAAIVEALHLLIRQPEEFRRRYHRPRQDVIAAYERQTLTEKLANLFNETTGMQ
jgi:glycosyltransferase involved in cell wall biosynthesis